MAEYYITPTLLNSWQYNINNGSIEDFIKTLKKEEFEKTEAIQTGFEFEKYMQENYEETKGGAYQVRVSKEYGKYLLYGIIDCLKNGIIYDYKYSQRYEVGKYYSNNQTLMYLEMVPEATKIVYLITNKFDEVPGEIFREEYRKDEFPENIETIINKFENWLKEYDLLEIYQENWRCK